MILLYLYFVSLIIFIGCEKNDNKDHSDKAPFLYGLKKASQHPKFSQESRQRAELAIRLWENGSLDSQPLVITSFLSKAVGEKNIRLSCFPFFVFS